VVLQQLERQINHMIHMTTFVVEFTRIFNNCDVGPAVQAPRKLAEFFKTLCLDIHKDGIFILGLTLNYLWLTKESGREFQLFKDNEELFFKYKDNLVGGPRIIFNHYQEKDVRGKKLCKREVGYDANSLYFYDIANRMLCGDHMLVEPYGGILKSYLTTSSLVSDISTPEHLKNYFAKMPPIFKNVAVNYNDLSEATKQ
jgi:hypothetical protein